MKVPEIVKRIQNKKYPEIDYSSQKNISYSQFSMYSGCQFRWSLQYKERIRRFTSSISTVFGTALHEVIQHYITTMYEKNGVEADEIDLEEMLEDKLRQIYKEEFEKNNKTHFSNPGELTEHFEDGIEILRYLKKNRNKYFTKKGWFLVGCEIPIQIAPNPNYPNVLFIGKLDLVMYHEPTNSFEIIDLKTSRSSWSDNQKKDRTKLNQLILYKHFFSELHKVPKENIKIEFIVLKRKLWENCDFYQSRFQSVLPASGPTVTKRALGLLDDFIVNSFEKNGDYKNRTYIKNPGKACDYCPFKLDKTLCPR